MNINLKRYIELELDLSHGIRGSYIAQVIDKNGRVLQEKISPNVIHDEGMSALHTNTVKEVMNHLWVGTNSSAVNRANPATVALVELLDCDMFDMACGITYPPPYQTPRTVQGWTNNTDTVPDAYGNAVDYTSWSRQLTRVIRSSHFLLNPLPIPRRTLEGNGVLDGTNLVDFGLMRYGDIRAANCNCGATNLPIDAVDALGLWTRQLMDAPFTITDTENEFRLTYTFTLLPNTTPTVQIINIGGIDYTVTSRAYDIDNANAWGVNGLIDTLGSWSLLGGGYRACEPNTMPALIDELVGFNASADYVQTTGSGSYYKDLQARWNPSKANYATGVGSLLLWPGKVDATMHTQIVTFNPKLPKDATKRLVVDFKESWKRPGID